MSMLTVKTLRNAGINGPCEAGHREESELMTPYSEARTGFRRERRRGSTMLEMALVFLVFAGMMLGAFDFGQFLFIHQALVERARWALRYAVANYQASTDSTADTTADATCISTGLTTCAQNEMLYSSSKAGTSGYFGLTSSMVTVTQLSQYASSSTCLAPGTSTNSMPTCTPTYNSVQILISNYPYKMLSLFSAGSYTGPNIYETFPMGQY